MIQQRSLYEPALDGLRLAAFAAVFVHHLPLPWATGVLARAHTHGWSGVELFFVISSFLLFRLLEAEHRKTGGIDIANFYIRRMLRIYPLMLGFSAAMFVLFSDMGGQALKRLAGIATFTDNLISAVEGYKTAIPFTGHLWTLGFEFQFYLTLPFVFLAWKRWGTPRFLVGLGLFYALCVTARTVMTAAGVPHPAVWVLPVLQPDALLLGVVLATGALAWVPRYVWPALCLASGLAFLLIRAPWEGPVQAVFSYALVAIASASLVQSVRMISPLRRLFALRPVVYLGTISFGLYVFHILCLGIGAKVLERLTGMRDPVDARSYLILFCVSLAATVVASALSYRILEAPFLRLKDRFSIVFGRKAMSADTSRLDPRLRSAEDRG